MKKHLSIIIFIITLMILSCSISNGHICLYNKQVSTETKNLNHMIKSNVTLQEGDIVWRWSYIPLITHCLLYVGQNEKNLYTFIEANSAKDVWMPSYELEWLQTELFPTVCRVRTDEGTIKKALDFAKAQVGKQFAYIHEKEYDPYTEFWYCTELIWASYYSVGIDIDLNGWHDNILFEAPVILPYEIYLDMDIELTQLQFI